MVRTTLLRSSPEITLQAIVDLKMAFLPEDEEENIRPKGTETVQLDLSKERIKTIELNVNIQELTNGNLAALNFSGDNVARFMDENGLKLINRNKRLLAADKSLLQVTRRDYIS